MKSNLCLDKFLIIFMVFTLYLDYFKPSALFLREFGAKPAILVMSFAFLIKIFERSTKIKIFKIFIIPFLIFVCGFIGFLWCDYGGRDISGYVKNPDKQFIYQGFLFFASLIFPIGLSKLFNKDSKVFLLKLIPIILLINLSIYFLEYYQIIFDEVGFLLQFRSGSGGQGRASGLFSEPSYYGVYVGTFGTVLMIDQFYKKFIYKILGFIAIFSGYLAIAKIMYPIIIAMTLFIFLVNRNKKIFYIFLFLISIFIYVAFTQNALNLNINMSVANRIGSALLALNALLDGNLSLFGVGFGQFHFYYIQLYAPEFLLKTSEAFIQFNPEFTNRASTYNFYLRLLFEAGILGFILYLVYIFNFINFWLNDKSEINLLGILLMISALTFYLTQDTYFYPPLVFALSLLLSSKMNSEIYE